jgi:hypothetical protein
MYDTNIPYINVSILPISNGFGGVDIIALTKLIPNLIRAIIEKTKINPRMGEIILSIFLFLVVI